MFALLFGFLLFPSAWAANFTVTSTADTAGTTCGATCTLRQAISAANLTATADNILFAIPGSGPHRISLTSNLPGLSAAATIDGYSQAGASTNTASLGSNAVLKIILDGSALSASTGAGMLTFGMDSRVSGLSIVGNPGSQGLIGMTGNAIFSGCWLGIEPDATTLRPNISGLRIDDSSHIGGSALADRNVIVATSVFPAIRVLIGASAVQIENNLIGLKPDGVTPAGNSNAIIAEGLISSLINNTISCSQSNTLTGTVQLVQNNRFGTTADGLGNPTCVTSSVPVNNSKQWFGNVFAHITGRALATNFVTSGVVVSRNRMFANSAYNFDLGNDGFTANDLGDGDVGSNNLQNFPVISRAERNVGGTVSVSGTLNSIANTGFRIEFFAGADIVRLSGVERLADAERVATQTAFVTTDASGNASFGPQVISFPGSGFIGAVCATATRVDALGSLIETSEFSPARITYSTGVSDFVVTNVNASGAGSFRQAFLEADEHPDVATRDRISFAIPGIGPHTITVSTFTSLASSGRLEIDGSSQVGYVANTASTGSNAQLPIDISGVKLLLDNADVLVRGVVMRGQSALLTLGAGTLESSFIGLTQAGTGLSTTIGNTAQVLCNGSCRIGGSTPATRNLIASPANFAVPAIVLQGANAVVENNVLGLARDGISRLVVPPETAGAQGSTGVYVGVGAAFAQIRNNSIGGFVYGIENDSNNGLIEGNFIGVSSDGSSAIGNTRAGIKMHSGNARIVRNVIANNGRDGILVGASSANTGLIENTMRNNGELGIDLQLGGSFNGDGVTPNDANDADVGGNSGQNYPVLANALRKASGVSASLSLASAPSTSYRLRYCLVQTPDNTGFGECEFPVLDLSQVISTDANGNFSGNTPTIPFVPGATALVATAARIIGGSEETSEISAAATIKAETSVTITAQTPEPSSFGQAVQISVSVTSGTGLVPTGNVNITIAGGGNCALTLNAGVGSCSLVPAVVGTSILQASYTGNTSFATSQAQLSHTTNPATTSTTILSDTPDPSTFGDAITVSFGVAGGVSVAPGSVQISDGNGASCTGVLSNGLGSCVLTPALGGSVTLSANYAGNSLFSSSSDSEAHVVNAVASSVNISATSPNPSVFGQAINVSANLSSTVGTPTGPIQISDAAGASCQIPSSSGSCNLIPINVGTLSLRADFVGNATHLASSAQAAHQVNRAAVSVSAGVPEVPAASGTSGGPPRELALLRFTPQLAVQSPGGGTPGGSITVSANPGTEVCVITLPGTSCEFILQSAGTRHFEINYPGDLRFAAASTSLDVVVLANRLFKDGFDLEDAP